MANNTRYYYFYDKLDNVVTFETHELEIGTGNYKEYFDETSYATRSYLTPNRALVKIMDYINKNNLENVKFEKD